MLCLVPATEKKELHRTTPVQLRREVIEKPAYTIADLRRRAKAPKATPARPRTIRRAVVPLSGTLGT
jgi:hypothetical protein